MCTGIDLKLDRWCILPRGFPRPYGDIEVWHIVLRACTSADRRGAVQNLVATP